MYNKTTVVIAAIVFALVGTLAFASFAPYLLLEAVARDCNRHSPDGQDGSGNDDDRKGCGSNGAVRPGPPGPT